MVRSVVLLSLLASSCAKPLPPAVPPRTKQQHNPYKDLAALHLTISKALKAVSHNAQIAKRTCYLKHHRSKRDWFRCVRKPILIANVWRSAIVPFLRAKLNEIYIKVKSNRPWRKDLTRMVCGLRRGLVKFKKYMGKGYDPVINVLSKIPPVSCPAKYHRRR